MNSEVCFCIKSRGHTERLFALPVRYFPPRRSAEMAWQTSSGTERGVMVTIWPPKHMPPLKTNMYLISLVRKRIRK
jgi:hypothetical protein